MALASTPQAFMAVPALTSKPVGSVSHLLAAADAMPEMSAPGAVMAGESSSAVCAVIATVGAAAAVAGHSRRRQRRMAAASSPVALKAFENELGVQAPLGFWDPMGLAQDGDVEEFRRRRETEIKHGRVSMFAVMGYITPEYYKFPGFLAPSMGLKFADVPNGLAAIAKVPAEGWLQWVALCGFYELCVNIPQDPSEPGNYGRGRLGFTGQSIEDPEARKRSLNSEIANGRLAMFAIMGMMFQNGVTGTTGSEMWFPGAVADGASPVTLRAGPEILEGTGGPFPENCWDPAGLTKGKSDEQLLRWRAVELKHGRVCMLAVLGWFHVAAGWHPLGDAAAGTPVSDNPLINCTQLPIGGAFQVVFTIMILEWLTTYVCKPPADKPWDILGWSAVLVPDDKQFPSWKNLELQEINNGRLAMVAFIGLVAQDLVTGESGVNINTACFGADICSDQASWTNVFPPAPGFDAPWWKPIPDLVPRRDVFAPPYVA